MLSSSFSFSSFFFFFFFFLICSTNARVSSDSELTVFEAEDNGRQYILQVQFSTLTVRMVSSSYVTTDGDVALQFIVTGDNAIHGFNASNTYSCSVEGKHFPASVVTPASVYGNTALNCTVNMYNDGSYTQTSAAVSNSQRTTWMNIHRYVTPSPSLCCYSLTMTVMVMLMVSILTSPSSLLLALSIHIFLPFSLSCIPL